jgi:hypothetical protein
MGMVIHQLLLDTADWQSEHNFKNKDTLVRSVVWYLEEFKDDPCETVILSDGKPAVELTFTFQVTDDIWLAGHLDRLVSYAGDYYVQDQKTTGSTLGAYYFNRYNPDNQVSLYSLAADIIYKTPVVGVMIDAAQVAVGFTRFARGLIPRTKDQMAEWLDDAIYHIKETWRAAEHGYPMNDKACQLYGGCEFLEVCILKRSPLEVRVRQDYLELEGFREGRPDQSVGDTLVPKASDHLATGLRKMLYIGDSGTGKTTSLISLVKAGYILRIFDFDNLLDPL